MNTFRLNNAEHKALKSLMEILDSRLSSAGCNDMELEGTQANIDLVVNAAKFGMGSDADDFIADFLKRNKVGKPIVTSDFIVFAYLCDKLGIRLNS